MAACCYHRRPKNHAFGPKRLDSQLNEASSHNRSPLNYSREPATNTNRGDQEVICVLSCKLVFPASDDHLQSGHGLILKPPCYLVSMANTSGNHGCRLQQSRKVGDELLLP